MSRPPSILVSRTDIPIHQLKSLYKKTHDLSKGLHILAIIDMIKYKNAESVAEFLQIEADTIRRWVDEYNANGIGSFEKKSPLDPKVN